VDVGASKYDKPLKTHLRHGVLSGMATIRQQLRFNPSLEAITLLYLCRHMDKEPVELREMRRTQMIENAVEINRIYRRIHETFKRRDESDELGQEWSQGCAEAHLRYSELWRTGGWHPDFSTD
jgi:hypothetical protein